MHSPVPHYGPILSSERKHGVFCQTRVSTGGEKRLPSGMGRGPGATETERGRVVPLKPAKSDYWSADGGLSAGHSWRQ